ncbi:MAG: ParB/RepB/Spo0J family partition protein [Terracidiphilus sp.]
MTVAATDPKRRALGKGLDSLLPRVPSPASAADTEGGKPREIPLDQIEHNPFQTRTHVNEEQLAELAASITSNGVVQPVLVRPLANGRFQLIAGERRWRASRLAGKKTIPANPMEQARAFDRLSREFHMTQEQMAVRTGKDRASVANFLRLLRLPASVQARVEAGELSFGHARTLLAFEHPEEIEKAAKRVVDLSLSVRQTETYVQGLMHPDRAAKKDKKLEQPIDPNVRDVQQRLQRALGLKVHIEDRNGRGKIIIEYGRLEDFDALLEQLAGE